MRYMACVFTLQEVFSFIFSLLSIFIKVKKRYEVKFTANIQEQIFLPKLFLTFTNL